MKERRAINRKKIWSILTNNAPFKSDREKGKEGEKRALAIISGLVVEGSLENVRRSSLKQNKKKGVDLWIRPVGDEFEIPVQVKSSARQAESFYREGGNPNAIMLVVTQSKNDETLRQEVMREVRRSQIKTKSKSGRIY
jgi:hypothetical protein